VSGRIGHAAPPSFEEFYPEARRAIRRAVGAGPDADDIVHEALLVVLERWDHVRSLDHPVAWARVVAVHIAGRRRQRDARRPLVEGLVGARFSGGDSSTDASDLGLDLDGMLELLRPELADAFRLTQLAGCSVAEAADILGVPAATVKVWVHRGRCTVKERSAGVSGRWICERSTSPADLERQLVDAGHGRFVDMAMPYFPDRPVRWTVQLADGRYWTGTEDGERMDNGNVRVGQHGLSLESVDPIPVGTSHHRYSMDGDRLRLQLVSTSLEPTGGVPDEVYRAVYYDDVVYRWAGPVRELPRIPPPR
jgi:RNA polymerase sigma factor (sigma-70 family)